MNKEPIGKIEKFKEIRSRFEKLIRDTESIISSNNPFANMIEDKPSIIFETYNTYLKFDHMRNSVQDEDQIQKKFENFLVQAELIIENIRKVTDSINDTALSDNIDESNTENIAKTLGEQVKKFKSWLKASMDDLINASDGIKNEFSIVENRVRGELMRYMRIN